MTAYHVFIFTVFSFKFFWVDGVDHINVDYILVFFFS